MDALPEELAILFRSLENTLLDEICSRLNISGQLNEVTVQDIRALQSHGIDLRDIEKAIRETTGISKEKLNELLDDVVRRNQKYYTELIDLAKVTAPDFLVYEVAIEAIRRQTLNEFRNITQSMGFLVDHGRTMLPPAKAYQWALDNAVMQIQSGAISYNQAIATAVKDLADGGLCVTYDAAGNPIKNMVQYAPKQPGKRGHIDHLDVAVRRATMTGVFQINAKYREQSMEYLKTDLVETTAHRGARNIGDGYKNHERWQGKIYRWKDKPRTSNGYYPDFEESCGYGSVTGILGANCRHSFHPFVEGIMEPTYSQSELDALNAENFKFEFEGKEYDGYTSTQKQREIERSVRKLTREMTAFKAAGRTEEYNAVKTAAKRLTDKYKAFSKAAGLPTQFERMRVLDK